MMTRSRKPTESELWSTIRTGTPQPQMMKRKTANDDEIKKAYRKRAMVHHPDRHSSASDDEKKDHETKFKEVGEAYAILSDDKKRRMYDSGQDLEDGGGHGFHDVDPNSIFQAFFGGGMGGMGGMGGGQHFQFSG